MKKYEKNRYKHAKSIIKIETALINWSKIKSDYTMISINIDRIKLIHNTCGTQIDISLKQFNERVKRGCTFCKNKDCEESKRKQTCIEKYGVDHHNKSENIKSKISLSQKTDECKNKRIATHNKNKSWITSSYEEKYYELLKTNFNDIKRQFKDDRYPFLCDFYIADLDIFIELNLHWSHGGEPFDCNNSKHLDKLKLWEEKSKTSKAYREAIKVWTERDVKKRNIANNNDISFIEIYEFPKEIFRGM